MTARGPSRPHNGHSKAPVRKALTGPNQRWCWDISYLLTGQKGEYLYLLLDVSSPQGQRPNIVEHRRSKKLAQRRRRREENQKQKTGPRK